MQGLRHLLDRGQALSDQNPISHLFSVLQDKVVFVHGLFDRAGHIRYQLVNGHPDDKESVLEPDKEKDPRQVSEAEIKGCSEVRVHGKEGAVCGHRDDRCYAEGVVPCAYVPDPSRRRLPGEPAQLPGIHPDLYQVVAQCQEGRKGVHRRKQKHTWKKSKSLIKTTTATNNNPPYCKKMPETNHYLLHEK